MGNIALGVPRPVAARLAPGVCQLDPRHGAVRGYKARDPRQHLDVAVVPDAEIMRADPAAGLDRGGFRIHERRTADRPGPEVHEVPVGGEAVYAAVLAHRRDADAVAQRRAPERDRVEQVRHRLSHSVVDDLTVITTPTTCVVHSKGRRRKREVAILPGLERTDRPSIPRMRAASMVTGASDSPRAGPRPGAPRGAHSMHQPGWAAVPGLQPNEWTLGMIRDWAGQRILRAFR